MYLNLWLRLTLERAPRPSSPPLVAQAHVVAWLAIQTRVPSPRALERSSGDLQSCYVVPDARGRGIGTRLADAVLTRARDLGLERVTVHASPRSIPVHERAGFRANPRSLWAEGAVAERSG